MRNRRNAVPLATKRLAAQQVARQLLHRGFVSHGQRMAIYAPFDGEIELAPLLQHAERLKLRLYVPRIRNMRARRMDFVALPRGMSAARMARNLHWLRGWRSQAQPSIDPRRLDVILIPVVAFDAHGWRLGFGAGFYDRKLAFMRRRVAPKPLLVGIGYDFQRVPRQAPSSWDVPLHAIVTERAVYRVRRPPPPQERPTPS